jgi:hypothetical protein
VRETLRVFFDGAYTLFPFLESSKLSLDYFLMFILTVYVHDRFPLKNGICENDRLFGGYASFAFFRFSPFQDRGEQVLCGRAV